MSYVDFYFTEEGRRIADMEVNYIASRIKGNKILSVGCGPGLIEDKVQQLTGSKVICVDKSEKLLREYKGKVDKIVCEAEFLPFKDEVFDVILFVTSLEFMEDFERALREGYRVLRREGKVIALLINQKSHYFGHKIRDGNSFIARYIKHFDTKPIERVIESTYVVLSKCFIVKIDEQKFSRDRDESVARIIAIEGIKYG